MSVRTDFCVSVWTNIPVSEGYLQKPTKVMHYVKQLEITKKRKEIMHGLSGFPELPVRCCCPQWLLVSSDAHRWIQAPPPPTQPVSSPFSPGTSSHSHADLTHPVTLQHTHTNRCKYKYITGYHTKEETSECSKKKKKTEHQRQITRRNSSAAKSN